MSKILGIDFGDKKAGFAISDFDSRIAFPRETLKFNEKKELKEKIKKYLEEESISLIVLGLPLSMKGEDTDQTKKVRDFHKELTNELEIKVVFQDERLSTRTAKNIFQERETKDEDALAAQVILQSYLDKKQ